MTRPENGYFASKAKRNEVKVKTSNYSLQSHCDEGITLSNYGSSGPVQFNLLAAIPGRTVRAIVETACPLRLHPDGTDQVPLHTGVPEAEGHYVGSSTVGNRMDLICEQEGVWSLENAVGTWTAES